MKDMGVDQRWDDVGSRWNFSMMIMGARSSYLRVSISIWGKQEVYNMLSKTPELFLKLSDFVLHWASVLSVEIHGILLESWCVWFYCMMAKCCGMDWYIDWSGPADSATRDRKSQKGWRRGWGRPLVMYQERPSMRSFVIDDLLSYSKFIVEPLLIRWAYSRRIVYFPV